MAVLFREACFFSQGRAKTKRNMSAEHSENEACGDRLHQAHLTLILVAHSRKAGDQPHQLDQLHSSSLQEKKSFLADVNQSLGAHCQTVHSKACFLQSLSNSMTLAHHPLPQSRGGLLGVSAKLVLCKGLWL